MKTLTNLFRQYEASHLDARNRLCHAIGIPLIIASLLYLLWQGSHPLAWLIFSAGWVFQFVGHAFERSWPEFLKNPVFLLVGPLYFVHKMLNKERS